MKNEQKKQPQILSGFLIVFVSNSSFSADFSIQDKLNGGTIEKGGIINIEEGRTVELLGEIHNYGSILGSGKIVADSDNPPQKITCHPLSLSTCSPEETSASQKQYSDLKKITTFKTPEFATVDPNLELENVNVTNGADITNILIEDNKNNPTPEQTAIILEDLESVSIFGNNDQPLDIKQSLITNFENEPELTPSGPYSNSIILNGSITISGQNQYITNAMVYIGNPFQNLERHIVEFATNTIPNSKMIASHYATVKFSGPDTILSKDITLSGGLIFTLGDKQREYHEPGRIIINSRFIIKPGVTLKFEKNTTTKASSTWYFPDVFEWDKEEVKDYITEKSCFIHNPIDGTASSEQLFSDYTFSYNFDSENSKFIRRNQQKIFDIDFTDTGFNFSKTTCYELNNGLGFLVMGTEDDTGTQIKTTITFYKKDKTSDDYSFKSKYYISLSPGNELEGNGSSGLYASDITQGIGKELYEFVNQEHTFLSSSTLSSKGITWPWTTRE